MLDSSDLNISFVGITMSKDLTVFFKGAAGQIEAVVSLPSVNPKGVAFINHPHPLFGGSMNNKVVYTIHQALSESGWITVRHNFRGVGASDGVFSNGEPEAQDQIGLIKQTFDLPEVKALNLSEPVKLIYAGFSFGSYVACLASLQVRPHHCFLFGTPPGKWDVPVPKGSVTLIHGQLDDVIPLEDVLSWASGFSAPVVVVPGASHFFDRKLGILKDIILEKIARL